MIERISTDDVRLFEGDCIEVMRTLPDASVDSIVTDPPYGLGFMGKQWDDLPPGLDFAVEALRVLKPGGHMLAFGGSRTWHRLAVAVEDAGFEIRDSIAWLYGSGFPKSLDVSKAIDKAAGAEREVVGLRDNKGRKSADGWGMLQDAAGDPLTAPATPDAELWQGWGTALKPAFEPVVVARKPLIGTVAANVLSHGTGALNIDASRIEGGERPLIISKSEKSTGILGDGLNGSASGGSTTAGRFPANVILDESQAAELDKQSGESSSKSGGTSGTHFSAGEPGVPTPDRPRGGHNDSGGASRFFYTAKADSAERPVVNGIAHPTVKPLDLMRYLVRLVTPRSGLVLEPFAGSGTTLQAALEEGCRVIGIERESDYIPLIKSRLDRPINQGLDIFGGAS